MSYPNCLFVLLKNFVPLFFGLFLLIIVFGRTTPNLYAETTTLPQNNLEPTITFSADTEPTDIRLGEYWRVVVQAQIESGWWIYALQSNPEVTKPVEISMTAVGLAPLTPWYESPAQTKFVPILGESLSIHKKQAFFYRNFHLVNQPSSNTQQLSLRYQACNDQICLPPKRITLSLLLPIVEGPLRAERLAINKNVDILVPQSSWSIASDWGASSLWMWLTVCFVAGFLALFTPCILPVLPLTIHFFSAHSANQSSKKATLVAAFLLGIIGIYTASGLLFTLLLGPFGVQNFASHPLTNLVAGFLFVWFGLSLLGFLPMRIPQSWLRKAEQASQTQNQVLAAFFIGISFTLSSFTCNIQIVGGILVSASQGAFFYPFIGLMFYALGFSVPFLALAYLPKGLKTTTKWRGWFIELLPYIFAALELIVALKFFVNYQLSIDPQNLWLNRDRVLILAILLSGASCLIFLWRYFHQQSTNSVKDKKNSLTKPVVWLAPVVFIVFGSWLYSGIGGYSLGSNIDSFLPPPKDGLFKGGEYIDASQETELPWLKDYEVALTNARKAQKPIFIEFTGYVCTNCRWMESNILRRKKVWQVLEEDFVLVRLYTDLGDQALANQNWQLQRFGSVALPFYAVLNQAGVVQDTRVGIVKSEQEFIAFLTQKTL